jgi:hypothetical protein
MANRGVIADKPVNPIQLPAAALERQQWPTGVCSRPATRARIRLLPQPFNSGDSPGQLQPRQKIQWPGQHTPKEF